MTKLNSMLTVPQILPTSPDETTRWQAKLEAAQNVIFCKELFTQVRLELFIIVGWATGAYLTSQNVLLLLS